MPRCAVNAAPSSPALNWRFWCTAGIRANQAPAPTPLRKKMLVTAARAAHHKPFVKLEPRQQKAFVQQSQDAAIADERAEAERKQKALVQEVRTASMLPQRTESPAATHQRSFILTIKELALLGFFTSQPGATQVLQYVAIPGAYHGCLPVNQAGNGKRWAT